MEAVDLALSILRVSLGLTLAAHGYNKVFGGGGISGTAGWFEGMGMRPGRFNAWVAALTEMGAGLLIAAGLLTTLGSAALIALMVVAGYTTHRQNGFFIFNEGWEYVFVLAAMALVLATLGPGAWSIDDSVGIADDLDGWTGFWIALGVGVGGAAGQLAVFYRPPPRS